MTNLAKITTACCIIAAALILATTVFSTISAFTSIPMYDEWDGYLQFYLKWRAGDYGALLALHNEHPILFSKLLFLADFNYFSGIGVSLIVASFIVQALFALVFCLIVKNLGYSKYNLWLFVGISLCFLYSGMQLENFSMKFQTCFFAVYFSALVSFLSLAKFQHQSEKKWLVFSIVFATASSLTMANGLVVWPLLVVLAVCLKLRWKTVLLLALLCVASWTLYFLNYVRLDGLGYMSGTEIASPTQSLIFLLQFFGSPFHFQAVDHFAFGAIPALAGALFIGLVIWAAFHAAFYSKENRNLQLALVAFLALISATGLIIAVSRSVIGADFAFVSRYSTPALLGWLTLLVYLLSLCGPRMNSVPEVRASKRIAIVVLICATLLICQQFSGQAIRTSHSTEFGRRVAMVGLLSGVYEPNYGPTVYIPKAPWPHDVEALVQTARDAQALNISIFDQEWLTLPKLTSQLREEMANSGKCTGSIDDVKKIGGGVSRRVVGTTEAAELSTILLFDERIDQLGLGVVGHRAGNGMNGLSASVSREWVAFLELGEKQKAWEERRAKEKRLGVTLNPTKQRLRAFVRGPGSLCELVKES